MVLTMDIMAMVSYIYYGKSVVQVLSPKGEVVGWGPGSGLDMPSLFWRACITNSFRLIMHGVGMDPDFNNARVVMHACTFNFKRFGQ